MDITTADNAVASLIAAMEADVTALANEVKLARQAMDDQSRNGAIGALSCTDSIMERLASSKTAAVAIHQAAR